MLERNFKKKKTLKFNHVKTRRKKNGKRKKKLISIFLDLWHKSSLI